MDHENKRTTYIDPRLAFAIEEKEHPNDFRQKYDGSSMALQVLHGRDLTGKVAIVTGANSGIGYETARSLAKHGCTVIFACRNLTLAENAIEKIRVERSKDAENCEAIRLDLSSLSDVILFTDIIKKKFSVIHMLILNAGVHGLGYSTTVDGYETTFQVCHLSHFYMTILLEPLLEKGSRVVIVSSESHR